jgi:hypothetical protein
MVADVAFFDPGEFVVLIMPEDGPRAAGVCKYIVFDKLHVLL